MDLLGFDSEAGVRFEFSVARPPLYKAVRSKEVRTKKNGCVVFSCLPG